MLYQEIGHPKAALTGSKKLDTNGVSNLDYCEHPEVTIAEQM
jgi:hypothetical protein